MTFCRNLHRLIALTLVAFAAALALPTTVAAEPSITRQTLFEENEGGYRLYRIPGIVVTAKGTVLAYCEGRKNSTGDRDEIEVLLRRSTDGGETWSQPQLIAHRGPRLPRNPYLPPGKIRQEKRNPDDQTVNNPVAIADRDGSVHLLYCVEYMRCFYIRSDDDGATWSEPVEITEIFEPYRSQVDWQAIATGPGHGVQLANGRLVAPIWLANYDEGPGLRRAAGTIFSDDGGKSWHAGDLVIPDGNESNVAMLDDVGVLLTSRNTDPRHRRLYATSPDGATQWTTSQFADDLLEPGCMAGLVRYEGAKTQPAKLLYSSPWTAEREHRARRNVSISLSEDNGRTWAVQRTVHDGPSAYSDLAVLPSGEILCFYENGEPAGASKAKLKRDWAYSRLSLARFNLEWLLENQAAAPRESKK